MQVEHFVNVLTAGLLSLMYIHGAVINTRWSAGRERILEKMNVHVPNAVSHR